MYFSADRIVADRPAGAPLQIGVFRMVAESRSAGARVGGDFFAFQAHGPKRLILMIGDACGRGREGARLLPSLLPRLEELSLVLAPPSRLLEALNRRAVEELPGDRFVTGTVVELDAQAGVLTVANAGHVPTLLRKALGEVQLIGRASGPPLGILRESRYVDERHEFHAGDVVVFMTDGALEAIETDLMAMGTLIALVAKAPATSAGVHSALRAKLDHQAEQGLDDMTLLSIELNDDLGSRSFARGP